MANSSAWARPRSTRCASRFIALCSVARRSSSSAVRKQKIEAADRPKALAMQSRQQVHCQRARGQGFDLERETETIRTQACRPAKNQWPVLTRNPNPLAKPMIVVANPGLFELKIYVID